MRKAVPVITAAVESLTQQCQREHHGRKKPPLHRRYVLASGHAQSRQEVAPWLGVHRHPIGQGLALDEGGGMEALLALYGPAGTPLSLPPEVLASIAHALPPPTGVAAYAALRQWVQQTHHREVNYPTLDSSVRTRCNTQLKVPRPSHTKNP
jgi:hypothetical protein